MIRRVGFLLCLAIAMLSLVAFRFARTVQRRLQHRTVAPVSKNPGESVRIAGLDVSVWRPGTNHAPLIIFSHGFHGSSTQSTFLMATLAKHGYLVLAPNHKDAMRKGAKMPKFAPDEKFQNPKDWSDATYKDRCNDITNLIKALKSDPSWSKQIDWSKVALAGHSLGGYTVLGLAGAWPSWKLPEVKAVLALSPYCTPYIERNSLGNLRIPVMYQGGTTDLGITPFVKKKGGAYDLTSSPAYFVDFAGAGHLAWTDTQSTDHSQIETYSLAFFDHFLKGAKTNPAQKIDGVAEIRSK